MSGKPVSSSSRKALKKSIKTQHIISNNPVQDLRESMSAPSIALGFIPPITSASSKVFAFESSQLRIPVQLLYSDQMCKKPLLHVNLNNWRLSLSFIQLISVECRNLVSLNLDNVIGINNEKLEPLRSHPTLSAISLRNSIKVDVTLSRLIASWPKISEVDVSECQIENKSFHIIGIQCSLLKKLICQSCPGLTDFILLDIVLLINNYHSLQSLDISKNHHFTDEGLLSILNAGFNCLKSINVSDCKGLSTLSMVGLRKQMTCLEHVEIRDIIVSISAFEWISEGCSNLRLLDLSRCTELDDSTLRLIGKKCKLLEKLILVKCIKVTDIGIMSFMAEFTGHLRKIDISGCILCGSESAIAISTKSNELTELRVNGLSHISSDSLKAIWTNATKLSRFEMCAELKSTSSHRRSMVPHISDDILKTVSYHSLQDVRLMGACLVTDIGACSIVQKCPQLTIFDVSYCNGITDVLLTTLATNSKLLTSLWVSGCNKIGDKGLKALSRGCQRLQRFEAAGCSKITDQGVASLATLRHLEILNLRNCDQITDTGLTSLSKKCFYLRVLDIAGLDMVSQTGVSVLTDSCRALQSFNASSCNITPYEFSAVTRHILPLAAPCPSKCSIEHRAKDIIAYNSYILGYHDQIRKSLVLNRFITKIIAKRVYGKLKKSMLLCVNNTQRLYRGHLARKRVKKLLEERAILNARATNLQKNMNQLMSIHFAHEKLKYMKTQDHAARLLQRVYRGHMSRKRLIKRKNIRAYFDKCFVCFVWRARLIYAARRLHAIIVKVQMQSRIFVSRQRFTRTLRRFRKLMAVVKFYCARFRRQKKRDLLLQQEIDRQVAAANIIKKNWLIHKHNRSVIEFINDCAIYYNNKIINENWYATKIQARFRAFMARKRYLRFLKNRHRQEESAIKIQSLWRRYHTRKYYIELRIRKKQINENWRTLVYGRLQKFYDDKARIIQRRVRLFLFTIHRRWAAIEIQRVYRGHLGRKIYRALLFERMELMATKIQRCYRRMRARRWRQEQMMREDIAARVIQKAVRHYIRVKARRKLNAAKAAKRNAERQKQKEEALQGRLRRAVENIYKATRDRYAMKIQRAWRLFTKRKEARRAAEELRLKLLEEAKQEVRPLGERLALRATDPLKRAANAVTTFATNDDAVHPTELSKLENSILKYQTQSVAQAGIIDIKLTVGEPEHHAFATKQKFLKNTRKPHFVQAEGGDVSGHLRFEVILWVKYGSGIDCICDMKAQLKPPKSTLAALEARDKNLEAQGIQLAWHETLTFEIHGICSLKQGKGGYAIDGVRICRSVGEAERADADGYFLVQDMSAYNFPTSLWAHLKRRQTDYDYPHSKQMRSQDWFDLRLDKCIQTYNMEETAIFQIRDVFERVQEWNDEESLSSRQLFRYLELPWTELSVLVINMINPTNHDQLIFSEYCQLVCAICMLGKQEMTRILFKHIDKEQKYLLSEEEFGEGIEFMTEGLEGQRTVRLWKKMYKKFLDQDTFSMNLSKFQEFMDRNPRVLWCFSAIQSAFWKTHLGVAYWERKMKNFKQVRQDLGVVILK